MLAAKDLLSKDYISIDVNSTVAKLFGAFKKAKVSWALIFEGKKFVGIISKDWLLTIRFDPDAMRIKNALKHRAKVKTPPQVPKLSLSTPLPKICHFLYTSNMHALPVFEKNKLVGVVKASDVLKALADEFKGIAAKEFAKIPAITIDQKERIAKAIRIMFRSGIDRLPVVDDSGKLVGILTMHDLIERFYAHQQMCKGVRISTAASHRSYPKSGPIGEKTEFGQIEVCSIISPWPMTYEATKETKIEKIIEMMRAKGVCSIILVEEEKPIGILCMRDILKTGASL
mgnify:CR=1 FL=1